MKRLFVFLIVFQGFTVLAQDNNVATLMKEGASWSKQNDYDAAIAKYKAVLKLEPENSKAKYEIAYNFFLGLSPGEGIPYLKSLTNSATSQLIKSASYNLLGAIYSKMVKRREAIESYKKGLIEDRTNQRTYYNLGLAYFMAKQYKEAEENFIQAIHLNPIDSTSIRMYSLTAYHQNKRVEALLGFCRLFIVDSEPTYNMEALNNLQNLLNGGALQKEADYTPTAEVKANANLQIAIIKKALLNISNIKYNSPSLLLSAQLKAVFNAIGPKGGNYKFGRYFYQLSQSESFPTYVWIIYHHAFVLNDQWKNGDLNKIAALKSWIEENKSLLD